MTAATGASFIVGQPGVYTIGVSNVGSAATTAAITVVDTLPAGLSYTSVAGAGWTCGAVGQVVTCTNAGPIAAGASDPLTVTVGVAAGALPSVTDTVRVATMGDVNAANDIAAATTPVNGVVDLAVTTTPGSWHGWAAWDGTRSVFERRVGRDDWADHGGRTLPTGLSYTSGAGRGGRARRSVRLSRAPMRGRSRLGRAIR